MAPGLETYLEARAVPSGLFTVTVLEVMEMLDCWRAKRCPAAPVKRNSATASGAVRETLALAPKAIVPADWTWSLTERLAVATPLALLVARALRVWAPEASVLVSQAAS